MTLRVCDVRARAVATLAEEMTAAGVHPVRFDAAGFASGVFLYRLNAAGFSEARKMLFVR